MNIRPAVLIIENNKLLSMRYRYGKEDVYCLPGGNLEFGESMTEGLKRELQEELCVDVSVSEKPILTGEVHRNDERTLHVLYKAEIIEGAIKLNEAETTALEICWISIENLGEIKLYPSVNQSILDWLENKLADNYVGVIQQKWY